MSLRYDWSLEEIEHIHDQPFPSLIYQAQTVHRENFPVEEIQRSTLLSIKTGGCSEDCAYCPQASRYDTGVPREGFLPVDFVIERAKEAQAEGSTRFCMGAAWRAVKDNKDFEQVLEIVRAVSALGMEVCCTLGMLTAEQAEQLKEAGCDYYNHNLDTSPEFYGNVITTHDFQDRLETLAYVRQAGMKICCGGIIGMGESSRDRLRFLQELAQQNPHPESVPVNMLIRIEGTPLEKSKPVDPIAFVRIIATARILMPESVVRLSAGRTQMSDELQALAFVAGANSIFAGEKLLTANNPGEDKDRELLDRLGMTYIARTKAEEHVLQRAVSS